MSSARHKLLPVACLFIRKKLFFLRHSTCIIIKALTYYWLLKGHKGDFPPSRLKSGSGEQCLWVLDRLADEALKAKNFGWKRLAAVPLFCRSFFEIFLNEMKLSLTTSYVSFWISALAISSSNHFPCCDKCLVKPSLIVVDVEFCDCCVQSCISRRRS